MKKYISEYISSIVDYLYAIEEGKSNPELDDLKDTLREFETKISYFQHERLIHLIVTVLFALLEMSAIYVLLIQPSLAACVFCVMFLILLVPYIMHYYFLENSVQRMYGIRDTLNSLIASKTDKA